MSQWEYATHSFVSFNELEPEQMLNSFGREGWELVSIISAPAYLHSEICNTNYNAIFKRRKPETYQQTITQGKPVKTQFIKEEK